MDTSTPRPSRRQFIQTAASLAGAVAMVTSNPASATSADADPPRRRISRGPFWPEGIRLVISLSMQFEAGAQSEYNNGAPFPPLVENVPDLPARSWFEYGIREGIPRLLDLWERHHIPVTSHMVGKAVELHPALAKEIVERGHEAAAHGQTWTPHWTLSEVEERHSYQQNIEAIEHATGTRPTGFNAFWLRGTPRTLGILQSLGFRYHIDDLSADEPMTTLVNGKPFAIVPYTLRNNDIARYGAEGPLTTSGFGQDLKNEFDQLYEEAGYRRRMMSISTHDRISGTPARVKVLSDFISYAKSHPGVVFLRKDAIAELALTMADVPQK